MSNVTTVKFKGHESFTLRRGWIYKGLTAVDENNYGDTNNTNLPSSDILVRDNLQDDIFQSKEANVVLGLGSNMCKALRYYLRASGLTEEQRIAGNRKCTVLTTFGRFILKRDPNLRFLETIALVHFNLSRNYKLATAWYIFFNRIDGTEISAEDLKIASRTYLFDHGIDLVSERSIEDDFTCIAGSYAGSDMHSSNHDPENILTSPFSTLQLLRYGTSSNSVIKEPINWQRLSLYFWGGVFLQNFYGATEIPLENLYEPEGSPGRAFNLNRTNILRIADELDRAGLVRTVRTSGLDVMRLIDGEPITQSHVYDLFSRCYKQKKNGELIRNEC